MIGPDYQFAARRDQGSRSWALTSVTDHETIRQAVARKELSAARRTKLDDIETRSLLVAVSVDYQLVSRLIAHPCCRTDRFAPMSSDPGAAVEWSFTIDQAKRPEGMRQILSGRAVFDPVRWIVREYRVECRNGKGGITTIDVAIDCQPGPGGFAVPVTMKTELVSDDKLFSSSGVDRYELLPQKSPPADGEFTLSTYGFSEEARGLSNLPLQIAAGNAIPVMGRPVVADSGGWYWWPAGAGVGFAAVGAVLLLARAVYARRRGQKPAAAV